MSDPDDDVVVLSDHERGQLRSAALMMAPMVRKDDPEVSDMLAHAFDLTDEELVSNLATGWSYVQPRIQASLDVIRATVQQMVDSYRMVFEQFMENIDVDTLREVLDEEGGGDRG